MERGQAIFAIGLDAALRSAPEDFKRTEKAKLEKESGLTEQLNKALALMPSDNGRKLQTAAAEPAGAREQRVRDGKATSEEIRAYLKEKNK
jgi:hypothetical protein